MSPPGLEAHAGFVAEFMRERASLGVFLGRLQHPLEAVYLRSCTQDDSRTACRLIFTRDAGHHSSGWFKNPDYERCLHLSISPLPHQLIIPSLQQAEVSTATHRLWLEAFFGEHARYAWCESPKSAMGRRALVVHWRVFCDQHWRPILPRKEVYSAEFTEKGWKTASQVIGGLEEGRGVLVVPEGRG